MPVLGMIRTLITRVGVGPTSRWLPVRQADKLSRESCVSEVRLFPRDGVTGQSRCPCGMGVLPDAMWTVGPPARAPAAAGPYRKAFGGPRISRRTIAWRTPPRERRTSEKAREEAVCWGGMRGRAPGTVFFAAGGFCLEGRGTKAGAGGNCGGASICEWRGGSSTGTPSASMSLRISSEGSFRGGTAFFSSDGRKGLPSGIPCCSRSCFRCSRISEDLWISQFTRLMRPMMTRMTSCSMRGACG